MLLASRQYDTGVDMWAFGCIAVEVLTKSVAFPWSSEAQMLQKIWSFAGTRKSDEWPSLLQLPQFRAFIQSQRQRLQPKKVFWVDSRGGDIRVGDVKAMPIAAVVRTHRSQA